MSDEMIKENAVSGATMENVQKSGTEINGKNEKSDADSMTIGEKIYRFCCDNLN